MFLDRTRAHLAPVQHGGLRQPGKCGGAPSQKGRGMTKRVRDTRQRWIALRASVGSTEAANEVVARFGVIDV
jgi:hypothetical protein